MTFAFGFPANIRDEVRALAELIPPASLPLSFGNVGQILISGEPIQIPARHCAPEPPSDVMDMLTCRQRAMMHCIYTRHHDGFVRQRHLVSLIPLADPWAPPYVILLLGEYVREIAQAVLDRLDELDTEAYARFGRENRGFICLTQQRVISYWACNYSCQPFDREPAYLAMRALGFWPEPAGRRLLPRRAV